VILRGSLKVDTASSDSVIKRYYRERAPVYDRVYGYPERREDLLYLKRHIANQFAGRDVLEVAAGTGYWTQFICRKANSILATDVIVEALAQVKQRDGTDTVSTRLVDAYSLDELNQTYTGAFAGLWFSHVPVERRREWLVSLHRRLDPGAIVVLLDNSLAQCERIPLSYSDERGNTYQDRLTDSGETYRVLKNFPTEKELLEATSQLGRDHRFQVLEHFGVFKYVVDSPLVRQT
jgi:demethylmenaquinone methyltransferase/2-methoxy-6-polyprenyl-1,4-benzoquinol methylase